MRSVPPWSAPPRHPSAAAAPGTPVVGALAGFELSQPGALEASLAILTGCQQRGRQAAAGQGADEAAHSKEVPLTTHA